MRAIGLTVLKLVLVVAVFGGYPKKCGLMDWSSFLDSLVIAFDD
jgi:hypothetical protein